MIKSLLDTDLYKLTMGQVFFKKYLQVPAEFVFVCRTKDVKLGSLKEKVEKCVEDISNLRYSQEELDYLKTLNLFEDDYLEYLKTFSLKKEHVHVSVVDDQLAIRIVGPMVEASPWEIYLLATVNELHFSELNPSLDYVIGREKLHNKVKLIKERGKEFKFMEFGTRRRHSQAWQEHVVKTLKEEVPENLVGTSNVYLAMKHGIKPVGTMAHEYLQAHQSLAPQLKKFQKTALKVWKDVYKDKLLVALTDTISTDSFLKDLDKELATSYTGLRWDSGSAFVFGEKAIAHYEGLGINPKDKTLFFTDSLDFPKCFAIEDAFKERTNAVFGIGTHLTNDVGVPAMNIVIKMVSCDNKPVAKISDEPTKAICEDKSFLKKLKKMFNIEYAV